MDFRMLGRLSFLIRSDAPRMAILRGRHPDGATVCPHITEMGATRSHGWADTPANIRVLVGTAGICSHCLSQREGFQGLWHRAGQTPGGQYQNVVQSPLERGCRGDRNPVDWVQNLS